MHKGIDSKSIVSDSIGTRTVLGFGLYFLVTYTANFVECEM